MSMRTLITGGGRGLGLELVRTCLERGHTVATTVRDPAAAAELTALQADHADRLHVAALDLSDTDRIDEAITAALAAIGGLDLLVNSAGVNAMTLPGGRPTLSVHTLEAAPMLDILRINTVAPMLVVRAGLPWLVASDHGRVVNVSSWIGSIGGTTYSGNYAYAASKAALNMCTRLLANELRPHEVSVVSVNPGWVQTGMGGTQAELTARDSATGIIDVAVGLTPERSGTFLQWDGSTHPW